MNNILSNSGLIHIRDDILGYLDFKTLAVCCQVSKHWNIWVEDFVRLSLFKTLDRYWDDKNYYRKVPGKSVIGWNNAIRNYAQMASVKDLKKVHESVEEFWRKDYDFWSPERYEAKIGKERSLMQCFYAKTFHYCFERFKGGNIETMKFLIDSSKELRIDINGFNDACKYATYPMYNQTEIVKLINLMIQSSKEYDINLNAVNDYGQTGFMIACLSGRTELVKILVNSSREFRIDLNARRIDSSIQTGYKLFRKTTGDRKTGFIYACINSQIEAVKWMIEKHEEFGIDIRRKDLKRKTALDYVNSFIAGDFYLDASVDEGLHEVKELLENEYRKPTHKYNLRSRVRQTKDDELQPVAKKFKVK